MANSKPTVSKTSILCACLLLAFGCAKKQPSTNPENTKHPKKEESLKLPPLNTGEGSFSKRNDLPTRDVIWKVNWKSGKVTLKENDFDGALSDVNGEIDDSNKPTATYVAKNATANKQSEILTLSDAVQVHSTAQEITLRCDSLTWTSKLKKIVAKGHVVVTGQGYNMGPLPEVWSNPDLTQISTPDLYKP